MNYWLMKSEPSTWSWNDQLARGEDGEGWDGVRNHQASNNMKAMEIGDLAFFYHSVNEKQIVGIVEVCETYHPDPTDASGRFGMVTVKAVKPMARPVALAEIKGDLVKAEWGQQIRSYVLAPYKMVKDLRTEWSTSQVDAVLDGGLAELIDAYLQHDAAARKREAEEG